MPTIRERLRRSSDQEVVHAHWKAHVTTVVVEISVKNGYPLTREGADACCHAREVTTVARAVARERVTPQGLHNPDSHRDLRELGYNHKRAERYEGRVRSRKRAD